MSIERSTIQHVDDPREPVKIAVEFGVGRMQTQSGRGRRYFAARKAGSLAWHTHPSSMYRAAHRALHLPDGKQPQWLSLGVRLALRRLEQT